MRRWTTEDSAELYGIPHWGREFLRINDRGHLVVTSGTDPERWVDLNILVEDIQRRGIALPLLLRFSDLLRYRVEALAGAFAHAIEEYGYRGAFRGVFPVKVNQQRLVVEEVVRYSAPYHLGLEAGSKPELLVVLAMLDDPEALIVCNGYKDREYVEAAAMAQELGRNIVVVVEKATELDLVLEVARTRGVRLQIGLRAKLSSRGAGRWEGSAGDRAKFGLTIEEIVAAVEKLRAADMLDRLKLLHYHIGSQVSAIRSIKNALREASRIYVELARLGAPLGYFDVGGGLGVDYDGSSTDFASSVNYTVEEYAYDVVAAIQAACDETEVPHPHIVTEAGRAMAAHHAVLVVDVLGVSRHPDVKPEVALSEEDPDPLHDLVEASASITRKNYQAAWHDAMEAREEMLSMFNLGLLSIEQRALGERIFWWTAQQISRVTRDLSYVPDEFGQLARALADTYFCNFSVFQSIPDSWAVQHLFPIVPIQRLDENPTRPAILADITCDSDGKIDRFIDLHDVRDVLLLHEPDGRPYRLGFFLVGAYQEILGDLHNLFGDTNTVRIALTGPGTYHIDEVSEGDTVHDVISYVQYSRKMLVRRVRAASERALREGRITFEQAADLVRRYQLGLDGYTYLK